MLAGAILFGPGIGNLLLLPPFIAQTDFDRADVFRVVAQAIYGVWTCLFGRTAGPLRQLHNSLPASCQSANGGCNYYSSWPEISSR